MAKEQTISAVWPEFVKSAAYQAVNIYPDGLIKESVKYFNDLLTSQFPLAWSQWQINEISLTMHAFVEQGLFDPDPDAIEILNATYAAIRAFLRFLVAADKIKVSSAQLEGLLTEVEDEDGQVTRESADVDALPRVVDLGDGLPQWQAATMEKLLHYTRDWVAAYFESATWKNRKLNASEELLSTLVETLSVSAYVDYRKTPKSWTKTAIVGVMTNTFVTETEFSDDEYLMIAPALKAFIGFVGQKGWLNAKRASDYQRYISAGEPVMLGLAQDQADDDTADDFGNDVNDLLKYPEALTALAKAIDPDSDQDYLKEHQ
ncbi:hypothetical protein [Lactiplantibacillus fabifermentans]|uniref:Uncharacterized protein n=1 Tax=Lactiplantibacillus fabifermentans DSM 21115 TaxID=1413187 RepID=A0A0R2NX45_9LACO|nr:hypothetical protein [Lactiplantibacillus fabifermentans]KRO28971.1 hypothetical protein DY78_GL001661 [Lactiplantibacillus fabifermentans DSM 21115]